MSERIQKKPEYLVLKHGQHVTAVIDTLRGEIGRARRNWKMLHRCKQYKVKKRKRDKQFTLRLVKIFAERSNPDEAEEVAVIRGIKYLGRFRHDIAGVRCVTPRDLVVSTLKGEEV